MHAGLLPQTVNTDLECLVKLQKKTTQKLILSGFALITETYGAVVNVIVRVA